MTACADAAPNSTGRCPTPSRRQPIFARNVVATSQPLATQAGVAMLARGGNAVDAALATAITLTVVEPCSNGIGSDLFAILWDGDALVGLNASGRAPAAWSRRAIRRAAARCPQRGWETVTIPGAVSGWVALSQRYGKLPFADLFEPAIRYARDGYRGVAGRRAENGRSRCRMMPQGPRAGRSISCRTAARPCSGERFASPGDGANAREDRALRAARRSTAANSREAMVAHAQRVRRRAHARGFRRVTRPTG